MTTDPQALISEFWARRSAQGGATAARFHPDHTAFDQQFLNRFCRPGTRVLDLGCGTLILGNWLVSTCGARVHGVDAQAAFLHEAVDHPGMTTEVADVSAYEPTHSYDVVLLFGVIQHISARPRRMDLYRRIAAHLEPTGVLLIKSQFGLERSVEVNGFSEELGCHYYSLYPHLDEETRLLSDHFDVTVRSVYPETLSPHRDTKFRHLVCMRNA